MSGPFDTKNVSKTAAAHISSMWWRQARKSSRRLNACCTTVIAPVCMPVLLEVVSKQRPARWSSTPGHSRPNSHFLAHQSASSSQQLGNSQESGGVCAWVAECDTGAITVVQQAFNRRLLFLACRHHMLEICAAAVFDTFYVSKGPDIELFLF